MVHDCFSVRAWAWQRRGVFGEKMNRNAFFNSTPSRSFPFPLPGSARFGSGFLHSQNSGGMARTAWPPVQSLPFACSLALDFDITLLMP